ncbi:MAG TPA: hypothetical protein VMV70_03835 [Gallionella sp.]|nr:hypothetical protein [Gallionella sp.]
MISNPIDISARVSPELSAIIETLIDQFDSGESLTLVEIRSFLLDGMPAETDEDEQLHHFDVDESVIDELDQLIEQFGESAAAMDFIYAFASEALSRVIEVVMNDENRESPPTLEAVQEAIAGGLGASLVGEGILEEDEDDVLMPEIEGLIERFGPDALAEDFLRYE